MVQCGSNSWGLCWEPSRNFPASNSLFDINTTQINHSPHFSIHFTLAHIHWIYKLPQLTRALTNTKSLFEDTFLLSVSLHKRFSLYFSIYFSFLYVFSSSAPLPSYYLLSTSTSLLGIGRFKSLVDSEEEIVSFRALYRISPGVFIRYCKDREWHEKRQEGEVVIPMIAFIEGRIRIPIGTVIRDYLRAHKLAPT